MKIGYFLSSEEFGPAELVRQARLAEERGFHGLWISDHYHPWNDAQGESPFVWSVIGALAQATERLPVTTAVTCPTVRIHPAVIAQAAATSALLLPGPVRRSASAAARRSTSTSSATTGPTPTRGSRCSRRRSRSCASCGQGGFVKHDGHHYLVENARVYSLPDEPPPVYVSGFGPKSIALAARVGDGYCTVGPDADAVEPVPRAGRRRQAGPGRAQGLLRPRRGGVPRDRAPAVAERGPARRARPDPPDARRTSSRRASS